MSDGRTYWDAEAEAKAKSENLYVLKRPVTAEQMGATGIEAYTFQELFTPLDVEALRQQIAETIDSLLVEYADIQYEETGWPDSYAGDVPWEVRLDKSKYKIVDAVLRVCGLTQEEQ